MLDLNGPHQMDVRNRRAKMGRAYPKPASAREHQIKESQSLCSGTNIDARHPHHYRT